MHIINHKIWHTMSLLSCDTSCHGTLCVFLDVYSYINFCILSDVYLWIKPLNLACPTMRWPISILQNKAPWWCCHMIILGRASIRGGDGGIPPLFWKIPPKWNGQGGIFTIKCIEEFSEFANPPQISSNSPPNAKS